MNNLPTVTYSNQIEVLFLHLFQSLFHENSSPFSKRIIIVPSPSMRSWLMRRLADAPSCGIAAGVEIYYLNQAIEKLCAMFKDGSDLLLPQRLDVALALEAEICNILGSWASMEEQEQRVWDPLLRYLHARPDLSHKGKVRLSSLCEQLALLFSQYGEFAWALTEEWERADHQLGWQQCLWRKLFAVDGVWSTPYRHLSSLLPSTFFHDQQIQVHLFAMSFLSHLHHEFFRDLSQISVSYYLLSPCQTFWSDLLSDRECLRLQSYWEGKGAPLPQQLALEDFLRDRNPLLANLGRLGRETMTLLEDLSANIREDYLLPGNVEGVSQYDLLLGDYTSSESHGPLTLLQALQTDLLLMRNPSDAEKIDLDASDDTIQIHEAPSLLREVQVLYERLLHLIDIHTEDVDPITPQDIVVMAPNIRDYEPYINMVFGGDDSQLSVQIADLDIQARSSIIHGFCLLLNLGEERWDVAALLEIFDCQPFQRKHHLKGEDLFQLQLWIQQLAIRWGGDLQHRNEILERHHCRQGMASDGYVGTWEEGISRLLTTLSMVENSPSSFEDKALFLEKSVSITPSQGDLAGKWIRILRSLRDDFEPLSDGTMMSLKDWSSYLLCLLETYFSIDFRDPSETASYESLVSHLNAFASAELSHPTRFCSARYSFVSIKKHLESLLSTQSYSFHETHLQAVRFCSMLPMRAIPAKIIYLLGMEESRYPRREVFQSFNLMHGNNKSTYCPSCIDYDRYLFLEAILSARRYLCLSYMVTEQLAGLEGSPSPMVVELLHYLDEAFTLSGDKTSDRVVCLHSYYPFDASNFDHNEQRRRSFSLRYYRAAQAYYHREKTSAHRFIPEFYQSGSLQAEVEEKSIFVDIKELAELARHPIRAYLRQGLGIYLDTEADWSLETEESFALTPLNRAILKRMALAQPFSDVLEEGRRRGFMPLGTFGMVASRSFERDVEELHGHLSAMGIGKEDLFDVELQHNCEVPRQEDERLWVVPSITLSKYTIVGRLRDLTFEGLFVYTKDRLPDVVKVWPQYLVCCCLPEIGQNTIGRRLLLGKSGTSKESCFEDPQSLLISYLNYWRSLQKQVSPLMPEWIPSLLEGDETMLRKQIFGTMEGSWMMPRDEYVFWSLDKTRHPSTLAWMPSWRDRALGLFGAVADQWYPKRRKKRC